MALTKVTGQVIKNTTDVTVGVLTVTNTLAVGGTVSIGGTLTYEDVTNIDSVGLITARNGIVVGSGITLSKDGDGFFTGVITATSYSGIDLSNVTGAQGDFSIADKIVHTGDTNTALRFPAADTFTVETGGSERVRITSDGKIGINVATPQKLLDVRGEFAISNNNASYWDFDRDDSDGSLKIKDTGTERARIDSSGRLLIGTTTEGEASADDLTIGGSGNQGITIRSGTSNYGLIYFSDATSGTGEYDGAIEYKHSDNFMVFRTGASERLRIDSNGHMGLGVTPNGNWPTNADFKALQIGTGACVFGRGSGDEDRGGIAVNYYHTGSAEKYLANGNASGVLLNDGDVDFFVAGANSSGANAAMSKTVAMRIAADADIGVGTLDPEGRLHIMGGNLGGAGSVTASTSANLLVLESNTSQGLSIITANDERASIYFGTTGTNGEIEAGIQYGHENVSTTADRRNMIFRQGGGERMRIAGNGFTKMTNSDGNYHDITDNTHEMYSTITNQFVCRMRCTGNGYILYLDNNGATSAREFIEAYSRSDTETKFRVNGSGSVYSRSNVFTSFSDVKLKENIVDANSQWDDIKAVKVRNYNFKKDPSQKMIGVIAQELETVSAGLIEDNIDRDPDTNEELGTTTKGVKYSILYMKAIKCLQEAQTRIETLEAKVAALEG